jgi:hypothetical protein
VTQVWSVLERVLRRPALSAAAAALLMAVPALLHTRWFSFSDHAGLGYANARPHHDGVRQRTVRGQQLFAIIAVHAKNIKDQRVHDASPRCSAAVASGQMIEPTYRCGSTAKRVAAVRSRCGATATTRSKQALATAAVIPD